MNDDLRLLEGEFHQKANALSKQISVLQKSFIAGEVLAAGLGEEKGAHGMEETDERKNAIVEADQMIFELRNVVSGLVLSAGSLACGLRDDTPK